MMNKTTKQARLDTGQNWNKIKLN